MSDRVSMDTLEADATALAWQSVQSVLDGSMRPAIDPTAVKLVQQLITTPCDIRIRPDCFELWHATRAHHETHPAVLAAPVLHHLMRLMTLPRLTEPHVVVLERPGLGATFPDERERAVWVLPSSEQVEILIRRVRPGAGPRAGMPVPDDGPWALPPACPRNERAFVAAAFPCPHCGVQPARFQQLDDGSSFLCPECGETFVPRISRF
jgi:predicted RNA-binding Zn-ribbon protein involved in translation (DUF1610 family)